MALVYRVPQSITHLWITLLCITSSWTLSHTCLKALLIQSCHTD